MAIDLKLTAQERKSIQSFMKPATKAKLINTKEKIGDKIPKDFNPRKG